MDTRTPAISVVMSVFNGERFVKEAIQSILGQSYTDFEFIIVDNHSSDNTCAIIQSFQDRRIKFIRNDSNLGQTRALNIGIRHSRGALIARMDADDIALSHRFARQISYLGEHPEIAVLGSRAKFINEEGHYLRAFNAPCEPSVVTMFMAGSPELSYGCTLHPTLMVRRSALDESGLYNEENGAKPGYPQDYELWSRMITRGFKFANLDESLLYYRVLRSSESRHNEDVLLQYRLEITVNKIQYYCPELTGKENLSLARMLEFRPQESANDGMNVLQLFDRYFSTYVSHSGISSNADEIRRRMKMYYLPVLFLTNKRLSVANYFRLVRRRPTFLADILFYRKAAKIILANNSEGIKSD